MSGSIPACLPGTYRRHEPEKTVLHAIVREHLETFLQNSRFSDGEGYPAFVEHEFRRFLDCGLLCRGFARLRCDTCGHEQLVAFSCKGRLCPSCQARRMSETAAYLVDQLLPEAPYRQWVLTVPWILRYRLSVDRKLMSRVLDGFLRTVFAWQRRRGRQLGITAGTTGAVSFLQRFGSAINLHPHIHSVLPDGLFVPGSENRLEFVALPPPAQEDVEALVLKIARRLTRMIEKLSAEEADLGGRLEETAAAMQEALARSLKAPSPADQLSWQDRDHEERRTSLCAKVGGFSLHAGQSVTAEDRPALERLCKYGLRAPFSQERLSFFDDGRILYELHRPWPDAAGVSELIFEPLELLRRLAALVPLPGTQMIRYHGVFANRSKLRSRLPPPPPRLLPEGVEPRTQTTETPESSQDLLGSGERASKRRGRLSWSQLLHRVFFLDAWLCIRCGGRMKLLAFLSDPSVVKRILDHLKLPSTPPPLSPARFLDPFPPSTEEIFQDFDPAEALPEQSLENHVGQQDRAPP